MRPIREYDVIDLLNNGRCEGEVEGYVVMDGPKYLGHMLYRVDGAVTQVLECGVEEKMFVDGAVRACVAAGENAGATSFRVNGEDEKLAEWKNVFFCVWQRERHPRLRRVPDRRGRGRKRHREGRQSSGYGRENGQPRRNVL